MSESFYGSIEIPNRMLTEEIRKEIYANFHESKITLHENGVLFCEDETAANGEFEDLEDLLVSSKIPFDRYSSDGGPYDEENRHYRPSEEGTDEIDVTVLVNNTGSYVPTADLKPLIDMDPIKAQEMLKQLINGRDPFIKPLEEYCHPQDIKTVPNAPEVITSKFVKGVAVFMVNGEWHCSYDSYIATRKQQGRKWSEKSFCNWCDDNGLVPIG